MKKINAQLDWNQADVATIQKYLGGYDAGVVIYSGNFKADWLLSGIHDSKWIIKTAKTVKRSNGSYRYAQTINWNRRLPDGTYLDSPENRDFLNFFQKAFLIMIESTSISPNLSVGSLRSLINSLMPFIQWSFRKDSNLNPRSD